MARLIDADARFCDIEVSRMPQADQYYKDGKWELDWENPADRIVLVKECGFTCDYDYFDHEDCAVCPAKEYCDQYQDFRQHPAEEDLPWPTF